MITSDTIKELASALCQAQAEMPAAPLNSTNPFFKSKYADLGSIIKTAQPILAKCGLSVSQHPVSDGGCLGVTTLLMHNSGEWMESTVYLPMGDEQSKNMAQAAGSVISYLRRYSLAAVLGMYADEDTDGNSPAAKPAQAKAVAPIVTVNPLKAAAEKTNGDAPPSENALHEWAELVAKAEVKHISVSPLPENVTTAQLRAIYAEVRDQVNAA